MGQSVSYYVYAYLRPNGTPYYIGKGKGRRAWTKQQSKIKVPEDKSRIVMLDENLAEQDAFTNEKFYIKVYGRKDKGTGILRNRTDGGEGVSGSKFIRTDEYRAKQSEIKKGVWSGDKNPMYGSSRVGEANPFYNKAHKDETRKVISQRTKDRMNCEEVKNKLRKPKPKVVCEHCKKPVDKGNYAKWHGNKCKMKGE